MLPNATANQVIETAVQPDGKIVAVGGAVRKVTIFGSETQATVTRLNPNGSLDTTFGSGGTVKLPVAKGSFGYAVALQPDGKILVGASVTVNSSGTDSQYAVARLNPNGSLDTSFGNNSGWWLANPTKYVETVRELEAVPTGTSFSIFVGGEGRSSDNSTGFAVVKLDATGRPVTSYGSDGFAVRHLGSSPNMTKDFTVTPSGRAVLAGPGYVVAFSPTGTPDVGFNGTGYVATVTTTPAGTVSTPINAVAAQGESIIVAGGYTGTGILSRGYVARYTPAGTVDPTFGSGGAYLVPDELATVAAIPFSQVKIGSDGSICLSGIATPRSTSNPAGLVIGRLSADGVADASFGTAGNGLVVRSDLTTYGTPASLVLDVDDNFILGGQTKFPQSQSQGYVLRFTHS